MVGRHRAAKSKIVCVLTYKVIKVIIGHCSKCNENKSKTVSYNKLAAEGLGEFFECLDKKGLNAPKKVPKKCLRKSRRASEIGAIVGNAVACKNPEADLSFLTVVINFYHTGN